MDGETSVADAHALTDLIIADIGAALAGAKVTIHIEPCEKKCPGECLPSCAGQQK